MAGTHPTPQPRTGRDVAFHDNMIEALTPLIDLLHLLSTADPSEAPDRIPRVLAYLAGLADEAWSILADWDTRRRRDADAAGLETDDV